MSDLIKILRMYCMYCTVEYGTVQYSMYKVVGCYCFDVEKSLCVQEEAEKSVAGESD
jgi:hypothetical protein